MTTKQKDLTRAEAEDHSTEPMSDLLDRMLSYQRRFGNGDRDANYGDMALAIRRQILRRFGAMQARIDYLESLR